MNKSELDYLRLAVEQARIGLEKGNSPFGSILVLDDKILFSDHNKISNGDNTNHPELAIAKYAAKHLTIEERSRAIVYTSGEHCSMCSSAHAWVGLGNIYYAFSTVQLTKLYDSLNIKRGNLKPLSINEVVSNVKTFGPYKEFEDEITNLHLKYLNK